MIYPKQLFSTNSKLKKDNTYSFGIPALKSNTGLVTCPNAGICAKGCYARQGNYTRFPAIAKAQEERLALTLDNELFVAMADTEIKKRKIKVLRIHDSGDFYSARYLNNWLNIISINPNTRFYAYTKMISMFQGLKLPPNFTVIYSEGGKEDRLIKKNTERHSRVFNSKEEMLISGYVDTTEKDINALGNNKRIGLVYHGSNKKAWSTSKQ